MLDSGRTQLKRIHRIERCDSSASVFFYYVFLVHSFSACNICILATLQAQSNHNRGASATAHPKIITLDKFHTFQMYHSEYIHVLSPSSPSTDRPTDSRGIFCSRQCRKCSTSTKSNIGTTSEFSYEQFYTFS